MSEWIDNPDSREGDYSGLQMEKKQQLKKSDFTTAMFSSWREFSDFDFRIISSEQIGQEIISLYATIYLSMLLS